jgi:hypothetical protein
MDMQTVTRLTALGSLTSVDLQYCYLDGMIPPLYNSSTTYGPRIRTPSAMLPCWETAGTDLELAIPTSLGHLIKFIAPSTVSHTNSAELKSVCLADVEQLSTLRGLRKLNLNHLESIKRVQGMASLTMIHTLHIGYSDVDRVYLHELSSSLPQLLSLDVA